jgi:diguanylate cyclase (GGDEF)-like protein/PAS domain S-box-containing protein
MHLAKLPRWRPLLLLLLLLAPLAAASLPVLELGLQYQPRILEISQVHLLEDPENRLRVEQARKALNEQGQLVQPRSALGYSDSTFWLGFKVKSLSAGQYYLHLGNPFINELEMWVWLEGELQLISAAGADLPFSSRSEMLPSFLLALPAFSNNSSLEVILRVRSSSNLALPMSLVPEQAKPRLLLESWLKIGMISGALLIIGLFHLFRYLVLRDRQLGYYTAAVFCMAWYFASMSGLTSLLFWSELPRVWWFEAYVVGMLGLILSTQFIISLMQIEHVWVCRLRSLLFILIGLVHLLLVVDPYSLLLAQLSNVLMLLTGIFQMSVTLLALHLRRPFAGAMTLIWAAVLVFMLVAPLIRNGLLPRSDFLLELNSYLPLLTVFLFGLLSGRQHELLRKQLIDSQAQSIANLEQYQVLFSNASEGIFRCSRDGVLQQANPSFLALLGRPGMSAAELQQHSLQALFSHADWSALLKRLHPRHPQTKGEYQLLGFDGQQRWVHLSLYEYPGETYLEGIVVDLSERRLLEQRLAVLAAHDPLTGLLNRRELERQLQDSLDGRGEPFTHLLYLDLDQFKQVNDLCGHGAGDLLLRQLATVMGKQLPAHALLARVGGDEFAILLREPDAEAALARAEALRGSVEQFIFTWEDRPFRLFVSIGLLTLDENVSDWETALGWADSASQLAKHQGRNRVHRFNPADGVLLEHQRQLQWITRLRDAIEHDHFELFQQPIMNLQAVDSGAHYELLLRYRDPLSGECIAPGQFLAAAERYGFLAAIDRWVIQRYCAWLESHPQHRARLGQVNINLSAKGLLDPEFHQLLDELIGSGRLPVERVCIEITEMVALGELSESVDWIRGLRRRGMKVALDDFGSGFASYAYLRNLPLDLLKIDGSFISGIEHDPINQAMVRSMLPIARELGLQTVAEFVETRASLECLREIGIDFGQGYFIGHPQPLAQLADADK